MCVTVMLGLVCVCNGDARIGQFVYGNAAICLDRAMLPLFCMCI